MIQGPSAGPAMVLNIFMRWPQLLVVLLLGGAGTITYKTVPPAVASTLLMPLHALLPVKAPKAILVKEESKAEVVSTSLETRKESKIK